MKIIGHRGAMGYEIENSLLSIKKALTLGVTHIEIDIQASSDKNLFLFHDRTTNRLTNKGDTFTKLTSKEIKRLRLTGDLKIPSLSDCIEYIDAKASLNIELKSKNCAIVLGNFLQELIKTSSWNTNQFIISSFDYQELCLFKANFPDFKIGVLYYGIPDQFVMTNLLKSAYSIHYSIDFLTKEMVHKAQHEGLKVYVYTVNNQTDYTFCKSIGVDGIFTNYPDIFD